MAEPRILHIKDTRTRIAIDGKEMTAAVCPAHADANRPCCVDLGRQLRPGKMLTQQLGKVWMTGAIETPILAEQGKEYIALQLKMYSAGERRNDVYGRMRTIAAKLTPAEIDGLATYYRAGFR